VKRKTLSTLIASLVAAGSASAQSTSPWLLEGSATVGAIVTEESGRDLSQIDKYRDLNSGVLSNILIRGRNDKLWIDAYGENFGRDDQYMSLRGGQYDLFKYRIYTNWLPHNFAHDARTPYNGTGTNVLTATFPQTDPDTWNRFTLGYQRKDTGGYFEWQGTNPWYFRVDGNQVTFDGTRVGAAALGTSPGNGFTDLAFPTSYTTNNVSAEVGYNTRSMQFSANYLYSKFKNDNPSFQWTNPFFGSQLDTTYQAMDNDYQRIALNGVLRDLPYGSTLAARYTYSKTENDMGVPQFALHTGGIYAPTFPNASQFNGEMINQTFTVSLTSTPVRNLDTKVYFNWYDLDNDSTQMEFAGTLPAGGNAPIGCGGAPCDNELYSYRKSNFGIEGLYRFDRANRLSGGWDYWDIDQTRVDYDNVTYNKFWVEYKNTSLPNLTARIKYWYLDRDSDFLLGDAGTGPEDPLYLERFVARFDNSPLTQNMVKLVVDWSPAPLFDTSLEYIYKDNDYKGTVLGRTNDRRNEVFATVSYGDLSKWRVTLMGDYEWVTYDSFHRNISGLTAPGAYDPSTPPTSQNYNWSAKNEDDNWMVGVGLDWYATPRLTVRGSLLYFESDGQSEVISQNNFGNPLPIDAYDNWKRTSLNLKGIYALNKQWSLTGGYAYERSRYNDIAFDGYQYTVPFPAVTNNTAQSYLNGYRAFTNGEANIFYLLATFKF
jgi:MtrB/PioB family decaheme-associated outer membrane protein